MARHQRGKPHDGQAKPGAERRPTGRQKAPEAPQAPQAPPPKPGRVISRRDERGVPYPGDWPNPLGGTYRGCF